MILKSDGALYIIQQTLQPWFGVWQIIIRRRTYLCCRQTSGFIFPQVFRCARKTVIVKEDTVLKFQGFGTMNGKDGKPFKTRDGGVMRLEYLVQNVVDEMLCKIEENAKAKEDLTFDKEEAQKLQKLLHLLQLNMGIFQIRRQRITF